MDTATIFFTIAWQNRQFILPIFLYFLATSFVGIIIFISLVKESSWKIILPAGVITGIFSFIVALNIFSYALKGTLGIKTILAIFILMGTYLFIKNLKSIPKIIVNFSPIDFIVYLLYGVITIVITFLCGAAVYGGDMVAYWGLSNSFVNGNYPVHSPWQPDLLATHHQGSFLYVGAANSFNPARVKLTHSIYSAFVLTSGISLVWGIVYKKTKLKLLSIIPALVLYFAMGAIFIYLPNTFTSFLKPEVRSPLDHWPLLITVKNRLGGAAALTELVYINHRAISLAGVILMLLIVESKLRVREFFKPTVIALLSIAIISSDEVYLPFIAFVVIAYFSIELFSASNKKHIVAKYILSGVVFLTFFFIVGSAVRDSLLTPSHELARFKIVLDEISIRLVSWRSAILTIPDSIFIWLLPSLFSYILLTIVTLFFAPNLLVHLISFGLLGIGLAYFFIEHTYYPSNEGRFLHILYQFLGFTISYNLLLIFSKTTTFKTKAISISAIFILFTPSISGSSIFIFLRAKQSDYPNLRGSLEERPVLSWIRSNIPHKRIFFVDGYMRDISYSYLTLEGIQDYGLFVPISPQKFKVHTPDWGPEAYDIIFSLNPQPIKNLNIDYIFITHDQFKYYSKARLSDLNNSNYFKEVYSDNLGVLYEIDKKYLNEGSKNLKGTLEELSQLVNKENIYIDLHDNIDFSFRSVLTLIFKDKNVYMHHGSGTFNYIETDVSYDKPSNDGDYDYLILGHKTDPKSICNCEVIKLNWENPAAVVYEVKY